MNTMIIEMRSLVLILILITVECATAQTPLPSRGDSLVLPQSHSHIYARVALTADGDRCLTLDTEGNIRLWNARSGQLLATTQTVVYGGDPTPEFIAGDRYYLTNGERNHGWRTAHIHDARTGQVVLSIEKVYESQLSFNRDGTRCLSCHSAFGIMLWDLQRGTVIRRYEGVNKAWFLNDGERFIGTNESYSTDSEPIHTLGIWNASDGSVVRMIPSNGEPPVYSPDSSRFVVCRMNGFAIGEVATGRLLGTLSVSNWERRIVFSNDNRRIMTWGDDTTTLWDGTTFRKIGRIEGEVIGYNGLAFSPDGKRIVTFTDYGRYRLYNAITGRLISRLKCDWSPEQVIGSCRDSDHSHDDILSYSSDGTRLSISPADVVGDEHPRLNPVVFNIITGKRTLRLRGLQRGEFFGTDGSILGRTVVWGKVVPRSTRFTLVNGRTGATMGSRIMSDGVYEPTILKDEIFESTRTGFRVRNASTGAIVATLRHDDAGTYLCCTERRIITGDIVGGMKLWDRTSKKLIATFATENMRDAHTSPDGRWIFVSSTYISSYHSYTSMMMLSAPDSTREIRWAVYSAEDGKPLITNSRPSWWKLAFTFSGDSKRLMISGKDAVIVYDLEQHLPSPKAQESVTLQPIPMLPSLPAQSIIKPKEAPEPQPTEVLGPIGPVIR